MSETNKALVLHTIEEVWNRGELAAVDDVVAVDYIGHGSSTTDGPEGYRAFYALQRSAFPDIRYEVLDQVAEGDRVLTRWVASATHTGTFQGVPPTGRRGVVSGMTLHRIADHKLVECWTNLDELGMLRQLGVAPTPPTTDASGGGTP
jgi:steroid delta-isomerase-like uncharacterized protein